MFHERDRRRRTPLDIPGEAKIDSGALLSLSGYAPGWNVTSG